MRRKNISSGTRYEAAIGYSRAVRIGNRIFVAGTVAINADSQIVGLGDSGAQTEFIIQKIEAALQQAGAELRDVVRTRTVITPEVDWEVVGEVHGKYFGDIRPAHTLIYVHGLIVPGCLVEIEAEAIISQLD